MSIRITTNTGEQFTVIRATDHTFLMTKPDSDYVYTLFHNCARQVPTDKLPCDETGNPIRSAGIISGSRIALAWDEVMRSMKCYRVKIVEYVGGMSFTDTRYCCAPSLQLLCVEIEKRMQKLRGEGVYIPACDSWNYGDSTAAVEDVQEVDREAVKFALQCRLFPLWLWVNE